MIITDQEEKMSYAQEHWGIAQSIMAKLLIHCSHPSLDQIPGCSVDFKEYRQSDSIEAFALLLIK